ncbi:hypothetical protein Tco_1280720 [Tanacetum coccineum]
MPFRAATVQFSEASHPFRGTSPLSSAQSDAISTPPDSISTTPDATSPPPLDTTTSQFSSGLEPRVFDTQPMF